MISAAGICVCLVTTFIATDIRPARLVTEIEPTLKTQLIISTVVATPVRPTDRWAPIQPCSKPGASQASQRPAQPCWHSPCMQCYGVIKSALLLCQVPV